MIVEYAFATPTYALAIQLRQLVLREPLGRNIADDPLHLEHDQIHYAAFEGEQLVGTATLQLTEQGLKMRQVAVHPEAQGKGIGTALVRTCERYARKLGSAKLYCHARATARSFYEDCGWHVTSEAFDEVCLEHFIMEAKI